MKAEDVVLFVACAAGCVFFFYFMVAVGKYDSKYSSSLIKSASFGGGISITRENISTKWIVLVHRCDANTSFDHLTFIKTWHTVVICSTPSLDHYVSTISNMFVLTRNAQRQFGFPELIITKYPESIGLFYAIAKGAEWIMETPHDGALPSLENAFSTDTVFRGLQYSATTSRLFSPSVYTGEKSQSYPNGSYRLCKSLPPPSVQLAFSHDGNPFAGPVLLSAGTSVIDKPLGILFHASAVASAFTSRDSLHRNHFIQALARLSQSTISIVPIYGKINRTTDSSEPPPGFVNTSRNWRCFNKTLERCALDLAKEFVHQQRWAMKDFDAYKFWLHALASIGYIFPLLHESPAVLAPSNTAGRNVNCRPAHIDFAQRPETRANGFSTIHEWCDDANSTKSAGWLEKNASKPSSNDKIRTVAVISNNWPWQLAIGLLHRLYFSSFGMVIFCGAMSSQRNEQDIFPAPDDPINFIHLNNEEMFQGYFGYYCLTKTAELNLQNVKGYFLFSDDTLFNFWHSVDLSKALGQERITGSSFWYPSKYGKTALNQAVMLIKDRSASDGMAMMLKEYSDGLTYSQYKSNGSFMTDPLVHLTKEDGWAWSDLVYFPASNISFFREVTEIFFEAEVFHEIVMSKLFHVVPYAKTNAEFAYLWDVNRPRWNVYYLPYMLGLHPMKPSSLKDITLRRTYCDSYIDAFYHAVIH